MRRIFLALLASASLLTAARAEGLKVAVSIKPLHSITAAVMAGAGEPVLLVEGAVSEHASAMAPSSVQALQDADAVIWAGHGLENFLAKPLEAVSADAAVLELGEIPGLTLYAPREGGSFDAHEEEAHDHGGGHEHDLHVWLDPANAVKMAKAIAGVLSGRDAAHAALYAANADAFAGEMAALTAETMSAAAGLRGRPFFVFHDAYQYYEKRFGLEASGSITVNPEVMPGAERLKEMQDKIRSSPGACVFSEPQFKPAYVAIVTEGTDARTGVLDPLGADIPAGPGQYAALIRALTASLTACLAPG